MSHVAFIPLVGFRIREQELLGLGMTLPGLQPRAKAIGQLPALGLLTLAGMLPPEWTCTYHSVAQWDKDLVERIIVERPTLAAISALTASINEACALLTTGPDTTIRIAGDEIVSMAKSRLSLMPTGLLDKAKEAELADLVAYLQTLKGKR